MRLPICSRSSGKLAPDFQAMPSPFPGINPFLEAQEWEDFHTRFMTAVSDELALAIEPAYVSRVERRIYVEHPLGYEDRDRYVVPDVAVIERGAGGYQPQAGGLALAEVVECVIPMPEERRETYLLIRERETLEVITVIEVLSPANKRRGGKGWRVYQRKRDEVLASESHLVEVDLLRGGERLPMVTPLPRGDYLAIVSRRMKRPRAQVTAWTLRDPLPTIPIPLKEQDGDVPLDLQSVFTTVYDRARYHLTLNYAAELDPPLGADELTCARSAAKKAVGSKQ